MGPWLLLQVADSAFPTGAFAHSAGLEAASQLGELSDLPRFVESAAWQAGRGALPFVAAAHDAPERLAAIDLACDATLTSPVANRASRTQGRALILAAREVFAEAAPIDRAIREGGLRGHLAPTLGATLRAAGATREETLAVFLHGAVRTVLSAAVRLGLVGPHEAQRLHRGVAPQLERVIAECSNLPLEEAAQTSPRLEVVGALHDRLPSRLFVS